ncbi:MAG: tetratricopeptide repeat protein [Chloroflexi bacterium]|nr:tetratricopeptide repeat protein [Chloroflexota bacterium]
MNRELQLAEAFVRAGELADALDMLNQHIEANPGDEDARRLRAAVCLRLADGDHLWAALADLDVLTSENADDAVQRSIILQRLGDVPGALVAMSRARDLRSDDDRITARYLELLALAGQRTAARDLLTALPRSWRWLEMAGDLARDDGDFSGAVAHYTAALDEMGRRMDTAGDAFVAGLRVALLAKRAAVCLAGELPAQAELDYLLLEILAPGDLTFVFYRGLALALRGELDDACATCRAALKDAGAAMRAAMLEALADDRLASLRAALLSA